MNIKWLCNLEQPGKNEGEISQVNVGLQRHCKQPVSCRMRNREGHNLLCTVMDTKSMIHVPRQHYCLELVAASVTFKSWPENLEATTSRLGVFAHQI